MLHDLPTVSANDLGNPKEPGEYQVNGKFFEVRREHIETWRRWPGMMFQTIRRWRINDMRKRFVVGAPLDPKFKPDRNSV